MLTLKDGSKIDLRELAKERNETTVRGSVVSVHDGLPK